MVDNSDGFLDGLPPGPLKKRFATVFKEAEEVQLKRQLLVYERMLLRNKNRLLELQKKQDSEESEDDVYVQEDSDSDQPNIAHQHDEDEFQDKDVSSNSG